MKVVTCLTWALITSMAAVPSLQADASELPPIRQNERLVKYLQNFQDIDKRQPPYVALELSEPFDTISIDVSGLESVAPRRSIA
jgi:hypothetical protein